MSENPSSDSTGDRSSRSPDPREARRVRAGESEGMARSTLDALSAHIAILDERGIIVAVNRAWRVFAEANHAVMGVVCEGADYLAVCAAARGPDAALAAQFAADLRAVMRGGQDEFALEYPCPSPAEPRWFNVRVARFSSEGSARFVVAHENITERKQAETGLRESERLLRTLMDLVPHFIFAKDRQSRHLFVNQACAAANGMTPEGMVGRCDLDFVADRAQAEAFMRDDREVIDGGRPRFITEERLSDAAGQTRILQTIKIPFVFPGTGGPALLGVAVDITDLKRVEAALRESEARFRDTLDSMMEGCQIIGFDWRYRYLNAAAARQGRSTVAGLLGRTIMEAYPGFETTAVFAQLKLCMDERVPRQLENEFVAPDGSRSWFHLLIQPAPEGIFILSLDISERKRAEDYFRALIENALDVISVMDPDGTVRYESPAVERVLGYRPEELIGRNGFDLAHPEDQARLRAIFAAATGAPFSPAREELRFRHKDGGWRTVEAIAQNLIADPNVTGVVVNLRDITGQRELEARFLRAQRMESIGSLASGIAHDLNNILAPILMCAPLLRGERSPEEREQWLSVIEASTQRAVGVVRQLLSFGRGREDRKAPLQLKHLLRELSRLARETFPRSIRWEQNFAPELWLVIGDATQLHQVLLNLCVNARDAMPVGGTLTLRADNVLLDETGGGPPPEAAAGPFVRIQVQDTGTGMSPSVREHIFDSFFTTKGHDQGTGLGLTTVQGIVKDHHGFVTFTTAEGKGTTFEILLPAAPEALASPQPEGSPREGPRGSGELVLLVDDEPSIRAATRRALEQYGYPVLQAGNGLEALEQFTSRRVEIKAVVTDFMMPQMDGLALCRALRRLSPQLPIIVSSGGMSDPMGAEVRQAFGTLGVRHILLKPHTADALLEALAEVLHSLPLGE